MTPRPGKVAEIVDIDLPRPRTIELFTNPGFGKITVSLRKKLGLGSGAIE
jgi:NitT/TauT family transport system ATP-binding protein